MIDVKGLIVLIYTVFFWMGIVRLAIDISGSMIVEWLEGG